MAVAFASRFSVLQIEDELSESDTKKPIKKGNNQTALSQAKNKKKKKTPVNEAAQLQSLFIGTAKQKGKSNSAGVISKSAPKPKEEQWEEWKQSDDKFVSESYHQDLEKALLLSKIELEEGKVVGAPENEPEKPTNGDQTKKKKKSSTKKEKPATLSLEQFQNLLPSQMEAALTNTTPVTRDPPTENRKTSISETDFFDKIGEDVTKIVKNEDKKDAYKRNEPFIADHARSLELRDVLEQKEKLNEKLQSENEELKSDLKAAKQRNRKLCNILAQGEIRDKAEILVQVEELLQIKDELAKEVSELSVALEQERSKVHQLQSELKKQGGKKDSKEAKSIS